jgi:D-inositol-3-phosphate glycosyltransferase
MRVALVSEHASPLAADLGTVDAGGQNVYVDALARHLARAGVSVDVYTRRDDADLPAVVDLAPGVRVHHLDAGPPEALPKDELFEHMAGLATALTEAWWWRPPDVAHAHFWMSGWACERARRTLDVPLVQTFHALGAVKQRHQGGADTSPAPRQDIERSLLGSVDAVIATCHDEVDELRRIGGRVDHVAVVPCGVDDRFRPGVASPRRTRVTTLGRMVERKGVADVIRAVARISAGVELVIAGGPPADQLEADPEVARLRAEASRLGISDRCRFVGRVGRGPAADLLRSSDVVACAPWYEPFGIVPVEAMACGVPVVGTAVGGLLDTIEHGVTGLLVPPRRPDLLAAALEELLVHPTRRSRMGRAGAARVDRQYRWPGVARDVLAVYQRVLAAGARRTERLAT